MRRLGFGRCRAVPACPAPALRKPCVACRRDTPTLPQEEANQNLERVEGWKLSGTAIERTFALKNFDDALAFFNKVAAVANAEDHHPDMSIVQWKKVRLSLTTHAAHGLTKNDFIVAAKIDALARNEGVK